MIAMLRKIIERRYEEEGVIAIITLMFLLTAGIASIVLLWSIGIATGAYNKLYIANQAAAYAAVTTATSPDPAINPGRNQLVFRCGFSALVLGDSTVCADGNTFTVAENVFQRSLSENPSGGGNFGIRYNVTGDNTDFYAVASNGNSDIGPQYPGLNIYEVPNSATKTRLNCSSSASGFVQPSGCWRVVEDGVTFPWQYTSGVVTRAKTTIPSVPGLCSGTGCPHITLQVKASASLNQVQAEGNYSQYGVGP